MEGGGGLCIAPPRVLDNTCIVSILSCAGPPLSVLAFWRAGSFVLCRAGKRVVLALCTYVGRGLEGVNLCRVEVEGSLLGWVVVVVLLFSGGLVQRG